LKDSTQPQNLNISQPFNVIKYSCPDKKVPIEGDSPEYQCCQYCIHLLETRDQHGNMISIHDWKCELPRREAQRRMKESIDQKQKVLA